MLIILNTTLNNKQQLLHNISWYHFGFESNTISKVIIIKYRQSS